MNSLSAVSITQNQMSYCSGDTLELSANTLLPIQWNGPGGFVSTENPVQIVPATPGISGVYTATLRKWLYQPILEYHNFSSHPTRVECVSAGHR
ncbi:MAG: hypothetical protein HWD58_18260 [Bacteroidota bacterium]|nr:MAG: hypothetical protein HWD58_18260 [Bacteroidota bacterium]